MAPRTRTNLAPNSSFNRALIRSAMVRKSKITSSGSGTWTSFMRSTSRAHSALASLMDAKVAIDDRRVAEHLAVVMDDGGVVGRVHQIVEIRDAVAGDGHQGNGDLTVVDGSRGQHA